MTKNTSDGTEIKNNCNIDETEIIIRQHEANWFLVELLDLREPRTVTLLAIVLP